jgi:ABC-type nitrate/sulfonate/bicarbonate transport system substrate-binding protein
MKQLLRTRMVSRWLLVILGVGFIILQFSCDGKKNPDGQPPLKVIRFGMLPYGDHTYAIIGAKQDWFKDVGIDFQYQPIKIEEVVPFLKNGTLEVVSSPPAILIAAYDNAPNLCSFVFGDLFQGFSIMAQPNAGYKSYSEFVSEGLSPQQAIQAAAQQLRGKTFAYPTEAAIKPFIDLALEKGNLKREDLKSLVLDDPLTVNAMRAKQADFQVGGVPSRLILQREGFKPILSSIDLVKGAAPSADSKELTSILQNGWATTKEFYEKEHDTVLRIASVNYRIMQFMNTDEQQATAIHMAYLSEVSGQSFSAQDGKIIYESLDPFVTFENQKDWFHNTQTPLYYKYINGSIIKSFVEQGIFKGKPPEVDDVIYADDIYFELEKMKADSDSLFQQIDNGKLTENKPQLADKYEKAKFNYKIYNFLDSSRLARDVVNAAH